MWCRELDLTGCPMISDASLAALSRHPANLHYMVDTGAAISTAPTQPESEVMHSQQCHKESNPRIYAKSGINSLLAAKLPGQV